MTIFYYCLSSFLGIAQRKNEKNHNLHKFISYKFNLNLWEEITKVWSKKFNPNIHILIQRFSYKNEKKS